MEKYSEYKDSGVQWLGQIPGHWLYCKLKYFVDILPGYAFKSSNFKSEGIKLLRGINVTPLGVRWDDVVYWSTEESKDYSEFLLKENDVVLGLDRPWISTGCRITFVKQHDLPCLLLQRVCRIRAKSSTDIRFIRYALICKHFEHSLTSSTTGVSVPHISTEQVLNFSAPFPPLSEQQAIVSYLDNKCGKIDQLLENKAKELELLAEMKQRVIADAVTKGLNPDVTMKDSGIPWLPQIPEHWELDTLRRFIKLVSVKNRPDKQLLSVTREQGVIVRDVDSKEENHNFIPEDLSNYKYVESGNFCINKMKSWQGSYGVSEYEGIVSPAYFVCKLSGVDKRFFSMAIRSKVYVSFFGQYSKGIRIDQWDLSPIAMKSIPFFLPPIYEQKAIVAHIEEKVSKIDALAEKLKKEIESIKEYKQRLISDVVTGQIKVC